MSAQIKRFRANLEPLRGNLGWVVARLPFDPAKAWKKMVRLRVKVETGGKAFRTSLFAETGGSGFFILINKQMQKAGGARMGGMIDLAVEPDLEEREYGPPKELEAIFKKEKALAKWYTKLSDSNKREIAKFIGEVKSPEVRQRRVEQIAERLLLTMEGEKVLPPILDVAFRRSPAALKGWQQMTPIQRRGHLMGIFHYRSPESQQKRTNKTIEDCLQVAAAKKSKVKAEDE
jgi:uncharacterized protein YdeI (YjbR/CyaY-like superfamily)